MENSNYICVYPASSQEKFDIICDEVSKMYPNYLNKMYFDNAGDATVSEYYLNNKFVKVIIDYFIDSIEVESNLNITKKQLAKFDEATGFKRANRNKK